MSSGPSASWAASQRLIVSVLMPNNVTVIGSVTVSGGTPRAGGGFHFSRAAWIRRRRATSSRHVYSLLRGEGQFTDDVDRAHAAEMAVGRCPYPHARIVGVDAAAALELPGVLQVITGNDAAAWMGPQGSSRTAMSTSAPPHTGASRCTSTGSLPAATAGSSR